MNTQKNNIEAGNRTPRQRESEVGLSMADERAITAVLVSYATGIDRDDWKLLAACFSQDAFLEYDGMGTWEGRDAFVNFMENAHATVGATMHKLSNFVISGKDDRAIATTYVEALVMPLLKDGTVHRSNGRYEDQLVRGKDGWEIKYRRYIDIGLPAMNPVS